ncbi:MAG: glycosyltransferase family 2 protein [Bacteroidota bacterium]
MKNKRQHTYNSFWHSTSAATVRMFDRFVLFFLFAFGVAAIINFGAWWFQEEHIDTSWMFYLVSVVFWYGIIRMLFTWYTYVSVKRTPAPKPPKGLSVAIFTTSYKGEPLEMVEKTLEACAHVSYPHTTYLLDNTEDPAFKNAAEKHGAVWLELLNIPGAKAGKINKALRKTTEEFILILDPDHIPFPNFFDEVLGYFTDSEVGFVQVSQAYYNQYRSFVAKGAAQQTYAFYGITQMGYYGNDSAVAIGANCTFRRAAFESIGGHVEGLAEDLQTSLQLHAAGWKSVYNPVVVNRGLVPEDFHTFCTQQLKWARGALEVLFVDLPAVFHKLNWKQKITYISVASYYINGLTVFLFTLFPFLFLLTDTMPVNMTISEFFIHGSWLFVAAVLFNLYTQKWMCDSKRERGFHFNAMILKYAMWPVFLYSLVLSLINIKIPYVPTEKKGRNVQSPFVKPLFWYVLLFIFTTVGVLIYRRFFIQPGDLLTSTSRVWVMLGFAFVAFLLAAMALFLVNKKNKNVDSEPWNEISDIKN